MSLPIAMLIYIASRYVAATTLCYCLRDTASFRCRHADIAFRYHAADIYICYYMLLLRYALTPLISQKRKVVYAILRHAMP